MTVFSKNIIVFFKNMMVFWKNVFTFWMKGVKGLKCIFL